MATEIIQKREIPYRCKGINWNYGALRPKQNIYMIIFFTSSEAYSLSWLWSLKTHSCFVSSSRNSEGKAFTLLNFMCFLRVHFLSYHLCGFSGNKKLYVDPIKVDNELLLKPQPNLILSLCKIDLVGYPPSKTEVFMQYIFWQIVECLRYKADTSRMQILNVIQLTISNCNMWCIC